VSFDVVLLSQVLEHVIEPAETVRHVHAVLNANAMAAIAVPHFGSALSLVMGKRDMFITPPEHLNYFSRQGLVALFGRNGFRLEELSTVSKVPRKRIAKMFPTPLLGEMAWRALYATLCCAHPFGLGMVLNAIFRKTG
jgi:2-polyprenyl-3-methyl-5-hydroxy-6-metoxy-1,4-benzoquinol methylase